MSSAEDRLDAINNRNPASPGGYVTMFEDTFILAREAVALLRRSIMLADSQLEYDQHEFSVIQEKLLRDIRAWLEGK